MFLNTINFFADVLGVCVFFDGFFNAFLDDVWRTMNDDY